MNIRNPDIQKAADLIRVGEDAERYRRLVRGGPAPDVDYEPRIRDLNVPRRALAVAQAQNAAAKDLFVVASRSLDVGNRRNNPELTWNDRAGCSIRVLILEQEVLKLGGYLVRIVLSRIVPFVCFA